MEMVLNTVRKIDYDQVKEYSFGNDKTLKDKLAIGILNPGDFKSLNLTSKSHLKIKSEFGEVVVKAIENEKIPKGMFYMPVSIWANQLTGIIDEDLVYKNIKVSVESTNEPIMDLIDLISKIKSN